MFLAAALIAVVCTYYMFGSMVSWFMDSQMQVLAESHTAETIGPPALRPLTDHHVEKGGLIVQIWDGQGSLLASSYPALAVPLQAADGFEEVKRRLAALADLFGAHARAHRAGHSERGVSRSRHQ